MRRTSATLNATRHVHTEEPAPNATQQTIDLLDPNDPNYDNDLAEAITADYPVGDTTCAATTGETRCGTMGSWVHTKRGSVPLCEGHAKSSQVRGIIRVVPDHIVEAA